MNRTLYLAALGLGAIAIAWIAAGYLGGNPLALAVTLGIGAFYAMGALELQRFHQATRSLSGALAAVPDTLARLDDWLAPLHPSLQNAVRLRVEGERVGLPGPAMTPYLVGLLVLLGMLGTFLGMVVTLNGAVLALESTTDLQAVRASLAAPVKGLGVAFGTSVAGVCASAMLGLMSALCRRERQQAGQMLDARIATVLRPFSLAHQRQETFKTLQAQAQLMPEVVERLNALMGQMAQQHQALGEQLAAGQQRFHDGAQAAYGALAASVGQSLQDSLAESARAAGATVRPIVEATMAGVARDTSALHERVAATVQAQLEGLSARFDGTVGTVSEVWTRALAQHERSAGELSQGLGQALQQFSATFEQRSAGLLATVQAAHGAWQGDLAAALADTTRETRELHAQMAETVTRQLDGVSGRFEATAGRVSDGWRDALAQHQHGSEQAAERGRQDAAALAKTLAEHAASLLASVDQGHRTLQAELGARDEQRLAAWAQATEAMAATLQREWQLAGEQTLAQQQHICRTLDETARSLTAETQAQATRTLAEIAQLMQAASQAPQAAAEIMGELRERLSDSLARDNGVLEERSRLLETLNTLLDAVNHASTEQRSAIDALVSTSTELMERVGTRFGEQVEVQATTMQSVAAQMAGGAAEVASLGDALGFAVRQLGESNQQLIDHLQRIEASLEQSAQRSDEQLAYYVAQAREIIDLSIGSQKQIVDDLQRLSLRPAAVAVDEAA